MIQKKQITTKSFLQENDSYQYHSNNDTFTQINSSFLRFVVRFKLEVFLSKTAI